VLLVTDRECGAEEIAKEFGVPHQRLVAKEFASAEQWQSAVTDAVKASNAELIVLCGYLRLLPAELCKRFPNRILNIHPGPLPEFGGKGMWGHHVHEAVIASGANWSGPTVHFVNEEYDKGDIIVHVPVPVLPDDTAETLAVRILPVEHKIFPIVIEQTIAHIFGITSK